MKKRLLSILLTFVMCVGMLPATAFAADGTLTQEYSSEAGDLFVDEDTEGPEADIEFEEEIDEGPEVKLEAVTVEGETIVPDVDLPENDELFAGYVEKMFYGYGDVSFFGTAAGDELSATDKAVYDYLKTELALVANGTNASAVFTIPASVYNKAGVKYQWAYSELPLNNGTLDGDAALNTFVSNFNLDEIVEALLYDCPYELYWFDKKTGYLRGYAGIPDNEKAIWTCELRFTFKVANGYKAAAYDEAAPTVDKTKTAATSTAISNAEDVIDLYENETDHNKLKAYSDWICGAVDYNHAAADNADTPYGDPWQLIYVFDGNSNTNVVCEGYAKAFQYLCDRTTFTDRTIECYSVSGNMSASGTITGEGPHMWNIVRIGDASYLVDVTSMDSLGVDGTGANFFLAGASGSVADGYTVSAGAAGDVTYTYDFDSIPWDAEDEELVLSATGYTYTPPTPPVEKISISGATVTLDPSEGEYTGSAHTLPTVTVVLDGKTLVKDTDYTVTFPSNMTDVGNKGITITGINAYEGQVSVTYKIVKNGVNINLVQGNDPFVYGKDITIMGAVTADNAAEAVSGQVALYYGDVQLTDLATVRGGFSLTYDTIKKLLPVGTHTLKVKYTGTGDAWDGEADVQITLNAKTLLPEGFSATMADRAYDGTKNIEVTSIDHSGICFVIGTDGTSVKDDVVISAGTPATIPSADAGTYTAAWTGIPTLSGTHASFYTVIDPVTLTDSVTISPKEAPVVVAIDKKYTYTVGSSGETIDLAALLPEDKGDTTYSVTTEDTKNILQDVNVSVDGNLTYNVVNTGAVGDTATLTVTATMKNYQPATITVNVELVAKKVPALDNGVEVAIKGSNVLTYGEPLRKLTLNTVTFKVDGNAVPGTLAWTDADAILNVGTTEAGWTFTPNDANTYAIVTGTVAIVVEPATLDANAPTVAAGLVYDPDRKLGDIALVTEAGQAGTWAWKYPDTKPVVPGNSGYVAVYTPADSTNFTTVEKIVAVPVEKASGTGSVTMESWTFGETAKTPVAASATNTKVTFLYKVQGDSTYSGTAPVNAGDYTVKAVFAATDCYEEATATADFTISRASVVNGTQTATLTYGDALALTINHGMPADAGTLTFTVADDSDELTNEAVDANGRITAAVQKNAGETFSFDVKVDSENYLTKTITVTVTVTKAKPVVHPVYTETVKRGGTLADAGLSLSAGDTAGTIAWDLSDTTPVTRNTDYTWTFTPDDAVNYEEATGTITLTVKKKPSSDDSDSGSAGGSSATTEHDVNKDKDMDNGSIKVNTNEAKEGDTVTITVDPDKGFAVDKVVIRDENGNKVEVTDNGDGTYSFVMPDSEVEIEAVFEVIEEEVPAEEEKPAETPAETTGDDKVAEESIVLTIGNTAATVDGKPVVNDAAPMIRNERTMLPIRFIANALGATVGWSEAESKVTLAKEDMKIEIFIGQPFALVNGNPVQLDSPAFIEFSRTYLPLRFIVEGFGAEVLWDGNTNTVTVIPGK